MNNKKSIEDKIKSIERELIFMEKKRKELESLKYNYNQKIRNIENEKNIRWRYNWLS